MSKYKIVQENDDIHYIKVQYFDYLKHDIAAAAIMRYLKYDEVHSQHYRYFICEVQS